MDSQSSRHKDGFQIPNKPHRRKISQEKTFNCCSEELGTVLNFSTVHKKVHSWTLLETHLQYALKKGLCVCA